VTSGNLFTATTADISHGSSVTLQKVESIQHLLGKLDRLVQESQDYWQGAASQQFISLMEQYNAQSGQLNSDLSAIGHGLQTTGAVIGDAESTNTNNIMKIQLPNANLS